MSKIDRLLGDVTEAQDQLTNQYYADKCSQSDIVEKIQARNDAVAAVLKYVTELKKQLEELTHHPDDDAEK